MDAAIAAGAAFFGALTGVAIIAIRSDPTTYGLAGGIAAGVAFFGSLAAAVHRPTPPTTP